MTKDEAVHLLRKMQYDRAYRTERSVSPKLVARSSGASYKVLREVIRTGKLTHETFCRIEPVLEQIRSGTGIVTGGIVVKADSKIGDATWR